MPKGRGFHAAERIGDPKMLVKQLILENFKGTANRTVNLDPECTFISGNIREGKTTIGAAIPFALYGATLDGSPRCDPLVRKGTKKAVVTVTVQVDGTNRKIKRTKTRKGTEVTLDGVEAAQADIDKLVGFSVKEFMVMYNRAHCSYTKPGSNA
jgi:DNA repair exonuclease SbcCD ATPase subunit